MDQLSLLNLLSNSTKKLASLHEELGHPPHRLEEAIQSLHNVLEAAVQGQLDNVQKEVDDAQTQIRQGQDTIVKLKTALGEEPPPSQPPPPPSSAGHSRSASLRKASSEVHSTEPLLPRVQAIHSEANRLQTLYNSRKTQADKLASQLDSFRPILGDFVPHHNTQTTDDGLAIIPSHHLVQLSATIDKCGCELTARSEQLQELLFDILGLWSELCLAPEESTDSDQPSFDSLILRHLDLKPLYEPIGDDEAGQPIYEFQGNFQGMGAAASRDDEEDDAQSGTPTRRSTRSSNANTLRSERSADTHFPPHILVPSPHNISRATAKQSWLRDEKQRREDRIQSLYDQLLELWMKFGVTSQEMDDFVMNNSGSTLAVVESYESELSKMQELKKTHMVYFISQVRETIDGLWGQLRTSREEREMHFPEYFFPLDNEADASEMDALLAKHEAQIVQLERDIETKLPILKIVQRYFDVLEEERQLEESAKDSTRLMRGVRGDPGRLLREEKMRKKVKVQKPKLEAELLKAIPAWEAENERSFTIDGERYYDKILALAEASAPKKRTRTVSTAQTPVVLQHSTAHTNRMGATPLRSGGPPVSASGVKRTKLASTPATGNMRAKVATMAPPPAPTSSAARQASTSRIPGPGHGGSSSPSRPESRVENPFAGSSRSATTTTRPAPAMTQMKASTTATATRPPVSSRSATVAAGEKMKRMSTEGYQASHGFRPRPSTLARTAEAVPPPQQPTTTLLPRNMSGTSIASDATTLQWPQYPQQDHVPPGYARAIPHPQMFSTGLSASARIPRKSVNKSSASTLRGPSMSLEGTLASLAAAGYANANVNAKVGRGGLASSTIRQVSGEEPPVDEGGAGAGAGAGGGANWARLDEIDDVDVDVDVDVDEMEVF